MDYPRMLYKSPGPHDIHGGKFDYIIVADEKEAQEAASEGWHNTTTEALSATNGEQKIPDDNAAPTRDELKQQADKLGIEYPKNIPTEKLAELVESAMKQ